MEIVRVDASPKTVHWGYFDGSLAPLATVASGDRVTLSTVSGGEALMPERSSGLIVPKALRQIHQDVTQRVSPGHICTGPIAVQGARPGHVLQIDIEKIDLHYNWGYNVIHPLQGALPNDFDESRLIHVVLDTDRMVGRLPWGMEIPLRPFFGVLAVAPPVGWGRVSTLPPRRNGGNLDNRELVQGATLYLPVHVDGALFSVGDGHGAQGDGEVCLTAIETGLIGTFRLTLREDMKLEWPMAETSSHLITMAFDPNLDVCAQIATRSMVDLICSRAGLDRYQALTLCSLAADLRITQVVNGNKGVHVMISKQLLDQRVN